MIINLYLIHNKNMMNIILKYNLIILWIYQNKLLLKKIKNLLKNLY